MNHHRLLIAIPLIGLSAINAVALAQAGPRSSGPDVIVGDLIGNPLTHEPPSTWGVQSGIAAYSVGTTSCNIGSSPLQWIAVGQLHPVIGQNLFRYANTSGAGRFEQIGQSWVKHAYCATQGTICSTCTPYGAGCSDHLGVGCSDPYGPQGNGNQTRLGPKSEVNAATGIFNWPFSSSTPQCGTGGICGRMQAHTDDIDPALNPGAAYFAEAQYVTQDDAAAGNANNNASYRRVQFSAAPDFIMNLASGYSVARESPAILAWQSLDPAVSIINIDIPADGRLIVAYKVTAVAPGQWHYEYALHNLNSDRSAASFSLPLPAGVAATNFGFHDVDYHSGDGYVVGTNYDGADWPAQLAAGSLTWSLIPASPPENSNALRWGTLYNFRFDSDRPPNDATITIGLFKPGSPANMTVTAATPCPRAGDFDARGSVTLTDIPPFVDHLLGLSSAAPCIADINGDGAIDGRDIPGFVAAL